MKLSELRSRTFFYLALLVGFYAANTGCLAQEKTPQDSSAVSETVKIDEFEPVSDESDFNPLGDIKFDVIFPEPISVEEFITFLREQTMVE